MSPDIKIIAARHLIGMSLEMTLAEDRTFELWNQFMTQRSTINEVMSSDLYCLQDYHKSGATVADFTPQTPYIKWAAIQVAQHTSAPNGMAELRIEGGQYAVFVHRGADEDFPQTMKYLFNEWLPSAPYHLDQRMHFQIMGKKYNPQDPQQSEEEIWIPVRSQSG